MDYLNRTFTRERVYLCNNSFTNCIFDECLSVFDGTGPTDFDTGSAGTSQFAFDGPAGTTLLSFTALYKNGAPHVVEEVFDNVRSGRYAFPDTIQSGGVN